MGNRADPADNVFLEGVVNRTEHEWRVAVDPEEQDLAKSNVFMLALYEEGVGPSVGTSQYFNISSRETGSGSGTGGGGPSTVSSLPGGASSTSTSGPNSATALLPSATADDAARAATSSSSSGGGDADEALPMAAKIGLGVAIPLAVILGLLAGWLLFRRRRRTTRDTPSQPPPHYYAPYQHPAAAAAMMVPDPVKPPSPGELPPGPYVSEVNVPNYGLHYELDAPMYDRRARGGLG